MISNTGKLIRPVLLAAMAFAATGLYAGGPATYTYTGNHFTSGGYPYTDSITGYFITSALAANLSAADITSAVSTFSFSDGINILTPANASASETRFVVSTDAVGNIASWDVTLISNAPPPNNNAIITCRGISTYFNSCPNGPGDLAYESNGQFEGYNQADAGTWSGLATSGLPVIAQSGVVSSASFQPGIVPGSFMTILGANLAPVTDNWANAVVDGNLPVSLDGVSVSVGGQPAYISYVSPTQINAVAPNVGTGTEPVIVTTPNGASQPFMAIAQSVEPAFFQWGNYAVATHLDYSPAAANGTLSVSTAPAAPGEVIILWGTGFGPTTPPAPEGVEVPSGTVYYAANPVTVTVGTTPATVYSTALSPGFSALYQVAIQIPMALADGDYPVVAAASGVQSPAAALITVAALRIQSLTFSTNTVPGGGSVMGTLTLTGVAPPGGVSVSLSSSDSAATVPATITVPAGATAVTFTVSAGAVSTNQSATIIATLGGNSVQASLTLAPTVNPQCANISGNWNASESGTANFSVVAPIESDMFSNPVSGSGTVTITQAGCSIQYDPVGESGLIGTGLTPAQLTEIMRTGTVSGNNVTVTGILALVDTVAAALAGVTNIQVSSNVVNASGQLAGGVITLHETGMFAATGDYSYQGQTGSFTLTITSSSVATFDQAFGNTPAASARSQARSTRSVWLRVAPGQEEISAFLRAALGKVFIIGGK